MTIAQQQDWWRAALEEYPTGVTLICSRDAQGDPVGMVVGSFAAVSQNPALVGFFLDATSTTFPTIAASGRFTASVLGSVHQEVCRTFVRKGPDRFAVGSFVAAPSGLPRLEDAVAWFDVEIEKRKTYGDHDFVVGRVDAFGIGDADAGLPLLFRRGGYGSFSVPVEELNSDVLTRQLRFTNLSGHIFADLADQLQSEVMVSAVVRDSVVVLAFAQPGGGTQTPAQRVGSAFPFAAPLAPVFAAWSSSARQSAWIEGSRHLVGQVDRVKLTALLASVRQRGYGVSPNRILSARFAALMDERGPRRESFARLWSDMASESELVDPPSPDTASAVQAPVFGPDGSVEVVITADFSNVPDAEVFGKKTGIIMTAAARVTEQIGGVVPPLER